MLFDARCKHEEQATTIKLIKRRDFSVTLGFLERA
jgi:hypothetical protein